MSKNRKDAIASTERMTLNDHQGQHNSNWAQRKSGIMEFNTNDATLAQNKLLTQTLDELPK